jgi:hypothetical protein
MKGWLYSQVPAFSASYRPVMDVLTVSRDARSRRTQSRRGHSLAYAGTRLLVARRLASRAWRIPALRLISLEKIGQRIAEQESIAIFDRAGSACSSGYRQASALHFTGSRVDAGWHR